MTQTARTLPRPVLLHRLGELVRHVGAERFAAIPLVLPSTDFLPRDWHGELADVRALLERVLALARIDVEAVVEPFDGAESRYRHRFAAWYAGFEDGVCRFGLDVSLLDDPQRVVAALCHEVAHAWREREGLVEADRDVEERLTDLTALFLGFGVLVANGADLWRERWTRRTLEQEYARVGYLDARGLCFALAAVAVGRGMTRPQRERVAGHLEANQAEWFAADCRELRRDVAGLCATLGLPVPEGAPAAADPATADVDAATLDGAAPRQRVRIDPDTDIVGKARSTARRHNQGDPVFRVREPASRFVVLTVLGTFAGALVGRIVTYDFGWPGWWLWVGVVLGNLGFHLAAGRRKDHCSGPRCSALQPREATVCPGCGGSIVGRLATRDELSEARDAWYETEEALRTAADGASGAVN